MSGEIEPYRPRLIDRDIDRALEEFGAVSIEGPKWCGKTTTGTYHSKSVFDLTGHEGPIENRSIAMGNIQRALEGENPHLIDEWQEIPRIWDAVRNEVDRRRNGLFILAGSSVPRRSEYMHSGAGRILKIRMDTMSLFESGDSEGTVSLEEVLHKDIETTECKRQTVGTLSKLILRGGWPRTAGIENRTYRTAKQYVMIAIEDACMLDGKNRNQKKMEMLVRSLARNESTIANDSNIKKGMSAYDDETIANDTYKEYMDCLRRIHFIDETPAFRPNVRSGIRIGKTPKRHLADVSLAAAAIGVSPDAFENDLNTLGFLFESLCEHDLKLYAEYNGGRLFHYRDHSGREADAVIETSDGKWHAIEVKLGVDQIDKAAENLLSLRRYYENEGHPPSSLTVVSGLSEFAYTRPDGVTVVPITALRP